MKAITKTALSAITVFILNASQVRADGILHDFGSGTNDGTGPYASLTLAGPTLYGTTLNGGGVNDAGTIFAVKTNGTGYTILHPFSGQPGDGDAPIASLTLSGSVLYGTTDLGGNYNKGVVFAINTNGTGYTILCHLGAGSSDPSRSAGAVTIVGSTLYGTTVHGGGSGYGTVFSVNNNGTGLATVHSFAGSSGGEGAYPREELTLSGSRLYGITLQGGSGNHGTVFAVNTDGSDFAVVHDFSTSEGTLPDAGLVLIGSTLYGTTSSGGSNDAGTVFRVNTNGTGFAVLHHFKAGNPDDGASPRGTLTLVAGKLCGATASGGNSNAGTLFSMNPDGSCYVVFHHFAGAPADGSSPLAGMMVAASNLYGTTFNGGVSNNGALFTVPVPGPMPIIGLSGDLAFGRVPVGSTPQRMLTITNSGDGVLNVSGITYPPGFSGAWSGSIPAGSATQVVVTFTPTNDAAYGGTVTLSSDASNGINTIQTSGTGALPPGITTPSPLPSASAGVPYDQTLTATGGTPPYAWAVVSGDLPTGLLLAAGSGAITGTPTVIATNTFQIRVTDALSLTATQTFTLAVLAALPPVITTTSPLPVAVIAVPYACVLTATGGAPPYVWTVASGGLPAGLGLTPGGNAITGTAVNVGTNTFTIRVTDSISLASTRTFTLVTAVYGPYSVIHSFAGEPEDGRQPYRSLTLVGSKLYGMTYAGGNSLYYGTLFSVNPDGSDYAILHHFEGTLVDGGYPYSSLVLIGGTLYGTTSYGGSNSACGTVFTINPDGSDYRFIHAFGEGTDGRNPYAPLTLVDGTLYGTTIAGGSYSGGTVYAMDTNGGGCTILHEFAGGGDGQSPYAQVTHVDGVLYGTTASGGSYYGGTVYRVDTNGSGYAVLHQFGSSGDGQVACAPLIRVGSKLYGTTMFGGARGNGTLFAINPDGSDYMIVHAFAGGPNEGAWPNGELTLIDGVFYGMTLVGGANERGTVYAIRPDGQGFVVLHDFAGTPNDGSQPYYGGLTPLGGMLYGMTSIGGITNGGTIFAIPSLLPPAPIIGLSGGMAFGTVIVGSSAQRTLTITNNGDAVLNVAGVGCPTGFTGAYTGAIPPGGYANVTITFTPTNSGSYGGTITVTNNATTGTNTIGVSGSAVDPLAITSSSLLPGGTVGVPYTMTLTAANGMSPYAWTLATGVMPAGLGLDAGGAITGTPTTVISTRFEVSVTDGMGVSVTQRLSVAVSTAGLVHSFAGPTNDGQWPVASVAAIGSRLYGTAAQGGLNTSYGTVFTVNADGSGYATLHDFSSSRSDGSFPYGDLVVVDSRLYGTTLWGGSNGWGTIYAMATNGSGFTLLHHFIGSDGGAPQCKLTPGGDMLYGATPSGGSNYVGTVFALSTNGSGYAVLRHFSSGSDGQSPQGGLVLIGSTLYGTASSGGSYGRGTIFKLGTDGSGFSVMRHFTMDANDGSMPLGALTMAGGKLYGTTQNGGIDDQGTVFTIDPAGAGYSVLHRFTGYPLDGSYPKGGLVLVGSTLYGTTYMGGAFSNGTVFAISTNGSGYVVLHSFCGGTNDGARVWPGVTAIGPALYGTGHDGGASNMGVVFKLNVDSLDSVGDGVADSWRAAYFNGNGGETNADSCASADPDNDGMSNLQEYLAGTDPTTNASALRFVGASNTTPTIASGPVVNWFSATGRYYRLERCTNLLSEPAFNYTVRAGIPATPPVNTETDTTATNEAAHFYQILLEP